MTIILPPPPSPAPSGSINLELQLKRDGTEWFIAANPIDLVLTPVRRARTTTGGTQVQDLPQRPIQRMRLISMSYSQKPTITDNGIEREIDLTLLGAWDCQMDIGDWWIDGEALRYEVVEMVPPNGYEVRGLVVKSGHG